MNKKFVLIEKRKERIFEFQKPTIENLDQAEEEFTLARLYLSKLKTEARSISGVRFISI
jgi:hypothetical protein